MRRVLACTCLCAVAWAASLAAQSAPVRRSYDEAFLGPILPDPVLQHAKETFVLFGCAYCHGLNLVSRGEATDLMHSVLVGRDENGNRIGPLLRAGIPQTAKLSPMPQFSDLSDGQITAIVKWIHYARQQGRFRELTTGPVQPGDGAAGKTQFENACRSCHDVNGNLAGVGRKYDAAALRAAMLDPKQQRHHAIVENISARDVADLVAYLRGAQ